MKKIPLLLFFAAAAFTAEAQKVKKQNKPKTDVEMQAKDPAQEAFAEMRRADEERRLSPMHHFITRWVGHWHEEMKIWPKPHGEPVTAMAEKESRLFAEGRFLTSTLNGRLDGRPYEAQSVLGFDNTKKMFVKTWADNLGSGILLLEGTFNEKDQSIDFRGTTIDPRSRQPVKVHQILKMIDESNQLLEVFMEVNGEEIKTMEVKSRKE